MKRFWYGMFLLVFLMTTGCWDRTEVNDLAFVMATALDLTNDGKLLASVQIPIPTQKGGLQNDSSSGGPQASFFVLSATGDSIHDVAEKLGQTLPRILFDSHRSVVIIGERLARHGIQDVLDHFSRDPDSRLRTYFLVAKGREARELLQIKYPLERVPAEAIRELEAKGDNTGVTLRDFLITVSSEGIHPVMASIEPELRSAGMKELKNKFIRLSGTAIFKELKLAGYLDDEETRGFLWIKGKVKQGRITADLPKGYGNVTLELTKVEKPVIKPEIRGKHVNINVELKGQGTIVENNSPLNLNDPKHSALIQSALSSTLKERVSQTVSKVQKKYKVDIFGFGQAIYQNNPKQWKQLKKRWTQQFPQAKVSVKAHVSIRLPGMTGPPAQLKEEEVKKQ